MLKMDVKRIEKLFQESYEKKLEFIKPAIYIVETHTSDLDDNGKNDLAHDTALGMAIGAAMSKNKHLLIGGAIGVGATVLAIGVINKLRKKSKKKEELED
jgi:DNA replication protein DnaC